MVLKKCKFADGDNLGIKLEAMTTAVSRALSIEEFKIASRPAPRLLFYIKFTTSRGRTFFIFKLVMR